MKKREMQFAVTQTHNRFDCEHTIESGRHAMTRRVDLRIGYIVTAFGYAPPEGFKTVQALVDRMNRLHKGANYTVNDIRPTLLRMRDEAKIVVNRGHSWSLTPNAKALWSKVKKTLRGV